MKNSKVFAFLLVIIFSSNFAQAQENLDGYNQYSIRPIHTQDQMYKQTHWTYVDLREKQNRPFFAEGNRLTAMIIDAVKAGILRPFQSDSLTNRMAYEDFIKNLTLPTASTTDETEFESGWGEDSSEWGDGGTEWEDETDESATSEDEAECCGAEGTEGGENYEFFPQDLYILEIKEDVIFDKKRSQMKRQIQSITIKIPAEVMPTGIEKTLASFSYRELVTNVFRDNPKAIYYNNSNLANPLNFADAFENRLYSSHLIKYANGDDMYVEDVYGLGKEALIAAQQIQYEMADREMDMWEN